VTNLPAIPVHVNNVIGQLALDPNSLEIWLIGSQATGNQSALSDWDLLLFSSVEPQPRARRREGIDVLHCGPSGTILLEGQPAVMEIRFASFEWTQVSPTAANYKGLHFPDFPSGVVRDIDEPSTIQADSKAVLLWQRSKIAGN
jgi:hypothetical protein